MPSAAAATSDPSPAGDLPPGVLPTRQEVHSTHNVQVNAVWPLPSTCDAGSLREQTAEAFVRTKAAHASVRDACATQAQVQAAAVEQACQSRTADMQAVLEPFLRQLQASIAGVTSSLAGVTARLETVERQSAPAPEPAYAPPPRQPPPPAPGAG
jgi:hypothetical protein